MSTPPGSGPIWRATRRFAQLLLPLAVLVAPLLGGWQRLDRNHLAAWDGHGWDLPPRLVDVLPMGDAPSRAYDAIVLAGGGTAATYFDVPVVDPVAGTLALIAGGLPDGRTLLAVGLVLLVGVLSGRAFCGWFCPFGTLARGVEFLVERLPWQPPRMSLPTRRPARFVLLAAAMLSGAAGAHVLMWLVLPHALVAQAGYGLWLMGGGGAALGALAGLVVAGVFFGPTTYCATLCPTGAALSLLGRRRPVRLTILEPARCGKHCDLCDHACWLSLHPSTGDPGPDCDACGRCTEVCPHDNLGVNPRGRLHLRVLTALALALVAGAGCGAPEKDPHRPRLILESMRTAGEVQVGVSVVDLAGIELDADDRTALSGREVSVTLIRGSEPLPPDARGKRPRRETYAGPLRVELEDTSGTHDTLTFERPNNPISTPNRTIYRAKTQLALEPGSLVRIPAVAGWLQAPVTWTVPAVVSAGPRRVGQYFVGGALLFAGLVAISLAATRFAPPHRPGGRSSGSRAGDENVAPAESDAAG